MEVYQPPTDERVDCGMRKLLAKEFLVKIGEGLSNLFRVSLFLSNRFVLLRDPFCFGFVDCAGGFSALAPFRVSESGKPEFAGWFTYDAGHDSSNPRW